MKPASQNVDRKASGHEVIATSISSPKNKLQLLDCHLLNSEDLDSVLPTVSQLAQQLKAL